MRQRHLHGAPVAETRLRIPGGDAIHRVWTVADGGGCTLVEVANDSPLPIACAFTRRDVLTNRPPAAVPIEGIDLPGGDHRRRADRPPHVGDRRAGRTTAVAPGTLPAGCRRPRRRRAGGSPWRSGPAGSCCRTRATSSGSSPARCELLLAGPPDAADDPAGYLLGVGELVRMGELADLDGRSSPTSPPPSRPSARQRRLGRRRRARRGRAWSSRAPGSAAPFVIWARSVSESGTIRAQRRIAPRWGAGGGRGGATAWRGGRSCCRRGSRRRGTGVDFEGHGLVCRAGVDAVVRRALARRAPGGALAGRRRSGRADRPRRRPVVADRPTRAARRCGAGVSAAGG